MKVTPDKIIAPVEKLAEGSGAKAASKSGKGNFLETLKNSIDEANKLQLEADKASKMLASGEKIDIHNAMIAVEKADVSFRMMMEVRNKIVEAYHEIMRMQV